MRHRSGLHIGDLLPKLDYLSLHLCIPASLPNTLKIGFNFAIEFQSATAGAVHPRVLDHITPQLQSRNRLVDLLREQNKRGKKWRSHLLLPTFVAGPLHWLPSLLVAIFDFFDIVHTAGRAVEPRHGHVTLPRLARAIRRDGRRKRRMTETSHHGAGDSRSIIPRG